MTQKHQRRLTIRSLWAPTVVAGLVILIALTFNVLGIHVMSGLSAWQEWRTHSYWHFFCVASSTLLRRVRGLAALSQSTASARIALQKR